jgi:3-oxoacyl-[acyl-carrier-protein] synthase II
MSRRVVVTGIGLITTLGETPAAFHQALCGGVRGWRHSELSPEAPLRCGLIAGLEGCPEQKYLGARNLRPLDRLSRLVTAAAHIVLEDSGWSAEMRRDHELGLVVGTMWCGAHTIGEFDRRALQTSPAYASPMDFANTVLNAAGGQAALWHDLRGLNATVVAGSASGLQAIAYAADAIRSGRADALIAGGVEELSLELAFGYDSAGMLAGTRGTEACPIPFETRRDGFVLGDAAALLMLEDSERAAHRGALVRGEILGHAEGYDRRRSADPGRSVRATAACISSALANAEIEPEGLDAVFASANGSPFEDAREAQALRAALDGRCDEIPVTAIKSCLGETLGASGPLQVVAALESSRTSALPAIAGLTTPAADIPLGNLLQETTDSFVSAALVNAFSPDGMLCSVVVARPVW